MMSEFVYEKEYLNAVRMEMTLLWTGAFIFGGGWIAFWVGVGGVKNGLLSALGCFFMILFIIAYFARRNILQKELNNLASLQRRLK
jgi:hypothetical protein